jgi:hypothetical protein
VTCLTCKCVFLPSGIISLHISFHHGARRILCGGPRAGVEDPGLVWRPQGWCGCPKAGMESPGLVWRPQGWCGGPRAGMEVPGLVWRPWRRDKSLSLPGVKIRS